MSIELKEAAQQALNALDEATPTQRRACRMTWYWMRRGIATCAIGLLAMFWAPSERLRAAGSTARTITERSFC